MRLDATCTNVVISFYFAPRLGHVGGYPGGCISTPYLRRALAPTTRHGYPGEKKTLCSALGNDACWHI